MPRLAELQKTHKPQSEIFNNALSPGMGEETLVVDERSRRSGSSVVDEKLNSLISQNTSQNFAKRTYPR